LKEKMLQGKESAFFSKELIKLMEVPELKWVELDKCSLRIDFNKWSRVLFDEWKMNGLKRWFEELKKKMMQPQQLGLF
jgi:5'-3' exonuclease